MKRLIKIIFKYKLYVPWLFIKLLYYNFIRIERTHFRCAFFPTRHAVIDIAPTATIVLSHSVLFGWCNMKQSKLETALYMSDGSTLECGGGEF